MFLTLLLYEERINSYNKINMGNTYVLVAGLLDFIIIF